MVNGVLFDQGGGISLESEPMFLRSKISKLKCDDIMTLTLQCSSHLLTLTSHILSHLVDGLERLERLQSMDTESFERFNVTTEKSCRMTS